MATKKKGNYVNGMSPKGIASFPHLNAPDVKFNAQGVYHTKLVLDPSQPTVQKFLDGLTEAHSKAVAGIRKENPKLKNTLNVNPPFRAELNDEGDETGKFVVNFTMYATSTKDGVTTARKPLLWDAKLAPIGKDVRIGGGSTIRVKFSYNADGYLNGTNAGIKLYMSEVQVIDLKSFGGGGSGFEVEDGFTAPVSTGAVEFSDESEEKEDEMDGSAF